MKKQTLAKIGVYLLPLSALEVLVIILAFAQSKVANKEFLYMLTKFNTWLFSFTIFVIGMYYFICMCIWCHENKHD